MAWDLVNQFGSFREHLDLMDVSRWACDCGRICLVCMDMDIALYIRSCMEQTGF